MTRTQHSVGTLKNRAGIVCLTAWLFWGGDIAEARGLGQATVTQVNNDVRYQPAGRAERPAKAQDVVRGADVVRTGLKSQTELEFEDRTITRIGSNSIFTFDPETRRFDLKHGLLLFDMPKGAGGGRIVTPAGTASIEGTAGVVSYRSPLKVICLAGVIKLLDARGGLMAVLQPGQMFIQGITKRPVDVKLKGMNGKLFKGGLPNNQEEHDQAANTQDQQLKNGQLEETPFMMIGEGTDILLLTTANPQQGFTHAIEELEQTLQEQLPPQPSGQQSGPQPTASTLITTGDEIDDALRRVVTLQTGATKFEGVLNQGSGEVVFDAGGDDIVMSGSPGRTGQNATPFKVAFVTQGAFAMEGLVRDDEVWPVEGRRDLIRAEAGNILIHDSEVVLGSAGGIGGELRLKSGGDIIVDPSVINASGPDQGGLIRLEGTDIVSLHGGGVDDDFEFSQLVAGGFEGGTVEMFSSSGPVGSGVFIYDAFIDVNSTAGLLESSTAQGGQVTINGEQLVLMQDTADIQANGPVAGRIDVSSPGTATELGQVTLDAAEGYIRLSAQATTEVLDGLTGGRIEIMGVSAGEGAKSVNITAGGITLAAAEAIFLQHARLSADAAGNAAAGTVHLAARNITIHNSIISASSAGGVAGRINIYGDVASGAVSVLNSSLTTAGATAGASSGIYIKASTVDLAGTVLNPGPAKVHIISSSNTGNWPTDHNAAIHWHQAGSPDAHF
jgi:hypothetical protein